MVLAGQAFHWFDRNKCRTEFERIGRGKKFVTLMWNRRDSDNDEFQMKYEAVLKQNISGYSEVTHKNIDSQMVREFLGSQNVYECEIDNVQTFEFEDFIGRVQSSSYCPKSNSAEFLDLKQKLFELFSKYQYENKIAFRYKTQVFAGSLKG